MSGQALQQSSIESRPFGRQVVNADDSQMLEASVDEFQDEYSHLKQRF